MAEDEVRNSLPSPATLAADALLEGDAAGADLPPLRRRFATPTTFRALRHRNYRLYFIGQVISLTGSWMQNTALMWLAFQLTGQNRWPSWINAAQILPTFLLGAWAGSLADRMPKRWLIFATQTGMLVMAVWLALLVWLGWAGPWSMLVVTTTSGLLLAIDLPARLAFVMDMVGRDDLMNAVALNSVLFNVARIIGPLVAVVLLAQVGPAMCFLFNAVSYVAVLWALAAMNVTEKEHAGDESRGLRAVVAGFTYLREKPRLLLLVSMSGLAAFCGWPFLSLLPGVVKHSLKAPDQSYGLLVSATGFGALAAAMTVASFGSWQRRQRFIAAGVGVISVSLLGISAAGSLAVAAAWCVLAGFGLILFFSTAQAVVQLSAGERNRGRIMGIWAMVISGGNPLGNLLVGPAADHWGESLVLGAEGLLLGTAALALLLLSILVQGPQSEDAVG